MTNRILCTTDITVVYLGRQTGGATKEIPETVLLVSRFGLAVRLVSGKVGKRKDLGLIPLRLSFLFKMVVVCGHCLVTLSITSY